MKYLLWDIDGTLMLSGGAGLHALEKVICEYYFIDAYVFTNTLAGRTDSDIIKEVVCHIRGRFVPAEAASLLIRYQMELPKQLPTHEVKVLKNVEKTLTYFSDLDHGYENCLLTGNVKGGAYAKLTHVGINHYFNYRHSAFGELAEDRKELSRILWYRLFMEDSQVRPQDLIFIGDTPNDVRCAEAIGAPCLVVLEGSNYKLEDFSEVHPWKIIDALPDDPAELEMLLAEIE